MPTRDETTQRVVDPLALLEAEGHSYLDAWCHLAEARRLFRLDRVTGLEVLDEPALEHDVTPRDLSAGLFEPGPDDLSATVRLHRVARWVAEYYPVESQTELDDGGLEVVLRVGDPQWLVRLMMRLSPYARACRAGRPARPAPRRGGPGAGGVRRLPLVRLPRRRARRLPA